MSLQSGFSQTVKLTTAVGIGGRYRPGCWIPVVVTATNSGTSAVEGQLDVSPVDDGQQHSAFSGTEVRSAAVYARPVTVSPGSTPQTFGVYIRNWDPTLYDLNVRLMDGTGNDTVLAQAPDVTAGSVGHPAAVPVTDKDLLLVGLADDPSAFSFLSGQSWGLVHTPSGPQLPHSAARRFFGSRPSGAGILLAPSVQVASASPTDLPDKSAAYEGVDAILLRADAPLESLTEEQTQALKDWVIGGGRLIVCGGADPSRLSSAFFADLLPARIDGIRTMSLPPGSTGPGLSLTPKTLPSVQVITKAADGSPWIVSGSYGAGSVTLTAFDPTSAAFRAWTGPREVAFWRTVVTSDGLGTSSVLSYVGAQEENPGYGYGPADGSLASAAVRAPSLDAPAASIIGIFLLGYLIILVPVNYLVLKRLDKKEWAWATIPVLVLIFAAATYGVGYAAKGSSLFVNRDAIIETGAGQPQAGVYAGVGLFSPHRAQYDMSLPQADALAASPSSRGYGYGSGASALSPEPRFIQAGRNTNLQGVAVNMWAMRAFDSQATTDLGGAIDAPLTTNTSGTELRGTIINHTAHDLTDCAVYYGGQWQTLGDLKHGDTKPIILAGLPFRASIRSAFYPTSNDFDIPTGGGTHGGPSYGGMYAGGGPAPPEDRTRDARQRMQPALADFVRSLAHRQGGYFGGGGEPADGSSYSPSRTEAILIGWNMDENMAGPSPQVDGCGVKQNDVNLVIVHIPVK